MNLLDMRTIVLINVVTDIVCVWFVVMLWLQNRERFAGTAFWVLDFVFQTAALILIVLRGAIPDWMSMVLSNTLVIAGANHFRQDCRRCLLEIISGKRFQT